MQAYLTVSIIRHLILLKLKAFRFLSNLQGDRIISVSAFMQSEIENVTISKCNSLLPFLPGFYFNQILEHIYLACFNQSRLDGQYDYPSTRQNPQGWSRHIVVTALTTFCDIPCHYRLLTLMCCKLDDIGHRIQQLWSLPGGPFHADVISFCLFRHQACELSCEFLPLNPLLSERFFFLFQLREQHAKNTLV